MAAIEQGVVPMLSYEDAAGALSWLGNTFGFVETQRLVDGEDRVIHAQMSTPHGIVMLASPSPSYVSPQHHREYCEIARTSSQVPWVIDGVLVLVDDIETHFANAANQGAALLSTIEESPFGRLYRTEDLEGHRWMFMEAAPDDVSVP
jgi:PhnB protein